jgi:hypothetical protein
MKKTIADYEREERAREEHKRRFKERQDWIDRTQERQDLTPSERLIAGRLGWHKNLKNGQCNPGSGTLARESGCDTRTVIRAIAKLESKGCIVVARTKGGGESNGYTLVPYPQKEADDQCHHSTGTPGNSPGGTPDSPPLVNCHPPLANDPPPLVNCHPNYTELGGL